MGGGDGGVAREVAKHPTVENIDQVEIDDRVVSVSKQFLPSMAVGFKSPKVNLFIEDGIKFIERHKNKYDVIITDSSDPIGTLRLLYTDHREGRVFWGVVGRNFQGTRRGCRFE